MQFPYMLIMRNSLGGCIWQAYQIATEQERDLLTASARSYGFIVQAEPADYTTETSPGWRDTQGWQDYAAGRLSPHE